MVMQRCKSVAVTHVKAAKIQGRKFEKRVLYTKWVKWRMAYRKIYLHLGDTKAVNKIRIKYSCYLNITCPINRVGL